MAKFKVGDKVRLTATCLGVPEGSEGVLIAPHELSRYPFRIKVEGMEKMAVREDEIEHAEVTPVTPRPKIIPARYLSGRHIGRVVTAESISGSVGVTATLEAVTQESEKTVLSFRNGGVFNANPIFLMTVDPDSEVTIK